MKLLLRHLIEKGRMVDFAGALKNSLPVIARRMCAVAISWIINVNLPLKKEEYRCTDTIHHIDIVNVSHDHQ